MQVAGRKNKSRRLRFERAQQEHKSLFRPFHLPNPFVSAKDVFCLRHKRTADGYRKVSIAGHSVQIPGIEPREEVELHFIHDEAKNLVEIRCWAHGKLVHSMNLPISELMDRVHFSSCADSLKLPIDTKIKIG